MVVSKRARAVLCWKPPESHAASAVGVGALSVGITPEVGAA